MLRGAGAGVDMGAGMGVGVLHGCKLSTRKASLDATVASWEGKPALSKWPASMSVLCACGGGRAQGVQGPGPWGV